jgi:hypothetical protein
MLPHMEDHANSRIYVAVAFHLSTEVAWVPPLSLSNFSIETL